MRFVYSLIRYVPRPATGEFVNIGAIVGNDESGYVWFLLGTKRASLLEGNKGLFKMIFHDAAHEVFSLVCGLTERGLFDLYCSRRNIVQFSEPMPISAGSVDEAVGLVLRDLIVVE